MIYELKPCFKHHWENGKSVVFSIVGVLIAYFFIKHLYNLKNDEYLIKAIIVIFLCFIVPQLILHLRYYWLSKGTVFYYYPNELKVKIRARNGEETTFFMDDIDKVKYAKSYPLAEDRMQWFPWDNYSYARIYLKNGKQFLITSLVVPNMNLPVEPKKIRLHKTFYAYPLKKEVPYKEKPVKEKRKYRNW